MIAGHGLPPVTAGIGVWLDGVGRAGMYRTAEQMNGRTRLVSVTGVFHTFVFHNFVKIGQGIKYWQACAARNA